MTVWKRVNKGVLHVASQTSVITQTTPAMKAVSVVPVQFSNHGEPAGCLVSHEYKWVVMSTHAKG